MYRRNRGTRDKNALRISKGKKKRFQMFLPQMYTETDDLFLNLCNCSYLTIA